MKKNLSPYVNTEIRMPKDMFDALVDNEGHWVASRIKAVSEQDVKGFLAKEYDQKMADRFKPQYLLPKTPENSVI